MIIVDIIPLIIFGHQFFQVVCLNTSKDLEEHIDISQLTADFDGSLDYDHIEWVQHRTVSCLFQHALFAMVFSMIICE